MVRSIVMQSFKPERWVEESVWKIQMGQADLPEPDRSFAGRHRYAVAEVKEIVGRIWKWVLLGDEYPPFVEPAYLVPFMAELAFCLWLLLGKLAQDRQDGQVAS
jgi:hypothetical protein